MSESKKEDYRPWGHFEVLHQDLDSYPNLKIKQIEVKVGAELSLQKHCHRSEHWIVLNGVASVARNEEKFNLYPGESTFIPAGAVHRLGNNGKLPLRIIEVQLGEYVEEDDIVRLEDMYGRKVGEEC